MPGFEHERVTAEVIQRYNDIFVDPTQEEQFRRHDHDINTTWFGVFKEADEPFLHYSNRIVDILQESHMRDDVEDFSERFPLLVSFVGQTGKTLVLPLSNQTFLIRVIIQGLGKAPSSRC